MYCNNDTSRNWLTAMDGVELGLRGLERGMQAAISRVDYSAYQGAGVPVSDYNSVVDAYNTLAAETRRVMQLLELREREVTLLRKHLSERK